MEKYPAVRMKELIFFHKVLQVLRTRRRKTGTALHFCVKSISAKILQTFYFTYVAGTAAGHLLEGERGGTGGDGDTLRVLAQASPSPSTGTDTHKLLTFLVSYTMTMNMTCGLLCKLV
jgi:hypothetical protein